MIIFAKVFGGLMAAILIIFGLLAIWIDEDLSAIFGLAIVLIGLVLAVGVFA